MIFETLLYNFTLKLSLTPGIKSFNSTTLTDNIETIFLGGILLKKLLIQKVSLK